MTITTLTLSCRDPIVSRDGRPFGAGQGNRMRTIGWPLPSVVAGSLRTAVGKAAGREFSTAIAQELLQIAVTGVFPVANGQLYLSAPQDCVVHPEQGPLRVAPQPVTNGCDWPAEALQSVMLSEAQVPEEFKPKEGPAWWPVDRYAEWLVGTDGMTFDSRFLKAPVREARTHVQIDADTGAADEGNLFTTEALALTHLPRFAVDQHTCGFAKRFAPITLTARVTANGWCGETVTRLDALHPLGGERRLVRWKATATNDWICPQTIADALRETTRVRMVLVTPAIFRDGWKPGWLDDRLTGTPGSNVTLKLVGVCSQRWRAVSGWSLAELPGQPRGPKPIKRMVPAGGVYFFEVENGSAATLTSRWLESVSDDDQDKRDGFGLAVWGIW